MCSIKARVLSVIVGAFLLAFHVLESVHASDLNEYGLIRNKRQLLWPNSTQLQFNIGIGTPSPAKMINVNWALQANFQLPWNRSQIPFDILETDPTYTGLSRKKREIGTNLIGIEDGYYKSDAKLYHFYQYVEEILGGFGQDGTSCVLRTLCQLGAEPLHSDAEDDLLHELANYVLNPKNDLDLGLTEKEENYHYIQAFERGENGQNCIELYKECTISFIDVFTKLHDIA